MKALGRVLLATAIIAGLGTPSMGMNPFNTGMERVAAGRAMGYMPTSKHVRKTNKLRCKHNAKLKRRKAR